MIKIEKNDMVVECPQCKNNTIFDVKSGSVSEDCCEIWVECVCGYDPTSKNKMNRYEDVWGGIPPSYDSIRSALKYWNDAINNA